VILTLKLAIFCRRKYTCVSDSSGVNPARYTLYEWLAWRWFVLAYPRERQSWMRFPILAVLALLPGLFCGAGLALFYRALGGVR
jgi:hypothetical protein